MYRSKISISSDPPFSVIYQRSVMRSAAAEALRYRAGTSSAGIRHWIADRSVTFASDNDKKIPGHGTRPSLSQKQGERNWI